MALVDQPLIVPGKNFDSDQVVHRRNMKAIEEFAQSAFLQLVPVGTILMHAGGLIPVGYLLCDGSPKSTTEYASLYSVIGTNYGGGIGTFNVPDFTSASATTMRVPVGAGTGVLLGTTTGSILSNAATSQGAGIAVNFIIKT